MAGNNPKISVLMPSYNQGKYLEAAIRSVLTQNYPHKELIVVDGGSTDESPKIIQRYQSQLTYGVSEPDRGQAHALNKGMAHATGQVIGWLNSDDYYLPGAFARVSEAFRKNPDAALVHGERIMVDEEGRVSGWTVLPEFNPLKTAYTICSETAFWQKSMAAPFHFDEELHFAMDVDYFCRLHQVARFVKLDDYLGAFRCHNNNKSTTIHQRGREETIELWREFFPDHPDSWKNPPQPTTFQMLLRVVRHPFLIGAPYLYRRIVLGRRGLNAAPGE